MIDIVENRYTGVFENVYYEFEASFAKFKMAYLIWRTMTNIDLIDAKMGSWGFLGSLITNLRLVSLMMVMMQSTRSKATLKVVVTRNLYFK